MSPTAIAADSAGNVYLTGPATVKYDSAGRRAWTARPKDNDINLPVAVRVDSSGNVYVAGPSNWSGNPSDFVTAKYDAQGNESWLRHYHSQGSLADRVVAMAIDETGNVYVTGTSGDDTSASPAYNWLTLKYDSNGELLWTARYSGPFNKDGPTAIAVGNQSQVYVTGTSTGFGSSDDIVTVKYESNGSQAWVARYDNPDHIADRAGSIALDAQGNVYVSGASEASAGTPAAFHTTLKYDGQGHELWTQRYREVGFYVSPGLIVADDAGDVYIAASFFYRIQGHARAFKYDAAGRLQWEQTIYGGDLASNYDPPHSLALDGDGNLILATQTSTLKLDRDGPILWSASAAGQTLSAGMYITPSPDAALDPHGDIFLVFAGALLKYRQVTVTAPAARIVTPADGTSLRAPARIFINAAATELPAKMEFWDFETKLAEDARSPFTLLATNLSGGTHSLTARFTTASGTIVVSPPVHINIITNQAPVVAITSPANGSFFVAPASVIVRAEATDTDGSVTKVEFFAPSKLGEKTVAPYEIGFNNIPAGDYTARARATDNEGAVSESAPVTFTVLPENSPPVIATQPRSQYVAVGSSVIFSVQAYGPSPLQYQWRFNGADLPGETGSQLTLPGVQAQHAGSYSVEVRNPYGRVTCTDARLTLYATDVMFRAARAASDDKIELDVAAPSGTKVAIEISTDLVNWTKQEEVTIAGGQGILTYPIEAPTRQRFYRLSVP